MYFPGNRKHTGNLSWQFCARDHIKLCHCAPSIKTRKQSTTVCLLLLLLTKGDYGFPFKNKRFVFNR